MKIDWLKVKKYLRIYLPLIVMTAVGIILDQVTKAIARSVLEKTFTVPVIPDLFHWTLTFNDGAAFSILEGAMGFFYVITVIVIVFLAVLYLRVDSLFARLCFCLIMPGAIGNFIDRLVFRKVTDFIQFVPFNFPIFNVADIMLVCGTIGLCIYYVFLDRKENHDAA